MRDPCPYCNLPGVAYSRVDHKTREIVRDIRDHACPAWATPPVLPSEPTDTSFIREGRNNPEAVRAYREFVKRQR